MEKKKKAYIIEPDMWEEGESGSHVYVDWDNEFRVILELEHGNGHYYSDCESWKLKGESLTYYYESGAVYYYDLSQSEPTMSPYIGHYMFGRESVENENGEVVVPIEVPTWAVEHFEESENRQRDGEFAAMEFARSKHTDDEIVLASDDLDGFEALERISDAISEFAKANYPTLYYVGIEDVAINYLEECGALDCHTPCDNKSPVVCVLRNEFCY